MSQRCNQPPGAQSLGNAPGPMHRGPGLSGFVKGFVIADLGFCGLRAVLVVLALVRWASLDQSSPLYPIGVGEILTGAGIVMFGLIGDGLILARKPWGVALGYVNGGCTLLNILVRLWEASLHVGATTLDRSEATKFVIGAGAMILIRAVLLGFYLVAVAKAAKALRGGHVRDRPTPRPSDDHRPSTDG